MTDNSVFYDEDWRHPENRSFSDPLIGLSRDIGALSAEMRMVIGTIERHALEDRLAHGETNTRLDKLGDLLERRIAEIDRRVDELAEERAEEDGRKAAHKGLWMGAWALLCAILGSAAGWLITHFTGAPPPPIPPPF